MLVSNESLSYCSKTGTANDVTFLASEMRQDQKEQWQAIVDNLLKWLREAQLASAEDALAENIQSAIDFAVDHRDTPMVPSSVGLTDDQGVSLAWDVGNETTTMEFMASGVAELTRFRDGRVVEEDVYVRNPQTRKLELRGAFDA